MPKLSHLRCFVTVAQAGSISIAAQRLHRSASAVSMTISNLEAEFEQALFESEGKSHLTPFGAYVLESAAEQINRFDRSVDNIWAFARNGFGKVTIGSVPSFASVHLPALLAEFYQGYPNITLNVRDDSSTSINTMIASGEIDIGIASPPTGDRSESVECMPLLTDPIGIVCSPDNELNRLARPIVWGDLEGQKFIANGTCRSIRDDRFQYFLARAEIDVKNTTSILAMVAANIGVTTLPRLAIPEDRKDVVFLESAYDDLQRTIGILTPSDRSLSPAATAFASTLKDRFLN